MHEMALAARILRVVLDAAGGEKVRRVRLQVGRLNMVVPDGLQFSFEMVAGGTVAAEASIEMEETPARLSCSECGSESELDLPPFNCLRCGGSGIEVISGYEVMVAAIELEARTIRRRAVPPEDAAPGPAEEQAMSQGGHNARQ